MPSFLRFLYPLMPLASRQHRAGGVTDYPRTGRGLSLALFASSGGPYRGSIRDVLFLGLMITSLVGCHTLPKRSAKEDELIAARELTRSGRDAMQHAHWREAEAKFAHALRECPSDPATHRHYAQTLWNRGARDEAIDHMRRAVALAGGDANWSAELGRMYLDQNREEDAMTCAEQALGIDRQLAAGWHLKASLLRQQGQMEDALACYHRAVTFAPDAPEPRLELAELYRELGRPRRALSMLQRLRELYSPEDVPAEVSYLQGLAFKALKRHDEATQAFSEAATKAPGPNTLFELAHSHFLAGRIDQARQVAYQGIANAGEAPQLVALLQHLELASPSQPAPQPAYPHSYNSDNRSPSLGERR